MSRFLAWSIHISALVLGGTGLVYGWLRYFTESEGEFALYNHPAEPGLRDSHILVAPLALFLWGLVWRTHVWGRFRAGFHIRRRTGIVLMVLVLPMVVSGAGRFYVLSVPI